MIPKKLIPTLMLTFAVLLTDAQNTFPMPAGRDNVVDQIMSMEIPTHDFIKLRLTGNKKTTVTTYLDNLRVLTPFQSNMTGYPSADLTDANRLMMGTIVNQNWQIGTLNTTSTYIFDLHGNLVDHRFSIPIGK